MIHRRTLSLKNKLIIYFMLISALSSIMITLYYYDDSRKILMTNVVQNTNSNLVYIMNNVEKQMRKGEQLSNWTFVNRSIEKLIKSKQIDHEVEFTKKMIELQKSIDDLLFSSLMEQYISSMIIVGNNGMDVRTGDSSALVNKNTVTDNEWFQVQMRMEDPANSFILIHNPSSVKFDEYIFPFVRPIVDTTNYDAVLGWSFIGFKTTLVSDVFEKYRLNKDESIYIVDNKNQKLIFHNDKKNIGKSIEMKAYYDQIRHQENGYITHKINGSERIVVYHKMTFADWTIVQETSNLDFIKQRQNMTRVSLLIFLGSIMISVVLSAFLSYNLTKPLRKLLGKMKDIAKGNFEKDLQIEGEDELGILGKGINHMTDSIRELLEKLLLEEEKKRKIELEMLQSQINPHFLYNTLNSIRWIAIIQKADGVRDAITSLGRLLKYTLGNTDSEINIDDEFGLLNDYIEIQKLRYKEKVEVKYDIEDAHYLKGRILKMTLQPIVENAIFHGIEPKKDSGLITISLRRQHENLEICVMDDGVGMSPDKVKSVLLNQQKDEQKRGFSKIGIRNVNERIKLVYGQQYGIHIESEEGAYTRVIVNIPMKFDGI